MPRTSKLLSVLFHLIFFKNKHFSCHGNNFFFSLELKKVHLFFFLGINVMKKKNSFFSLILYIAFNFKFFIRWVRGVRGGTKTKWSIIFHPSNLVVASSSEFRDLEHFRGMFCDVVRQ